jgi:hypothetical protein
MPSGKGAQERRRLKRLPLQQKFENSGQQGAGWSQLDASQDSSLGLQLDASQDAGSESNAVTPEGSPPASAGNGAEPRLSGGTMNGAAALLARQWGLDNHLAHSAAAPAASPQTGRCRSSSSDDPVEDTAPASSAAVAAVGRAAPQPAQWPTLTTSFSRRKGPEERAREAREAEAQRAAANAPGAAVGPSGAAQDAAQDVVNDRDGVQHRGTLQLPRRGPPSSADLARLRPLMSALGDALGVAARSEGGAVGTCGTAQPASGGAGPSMAPTNSPAGTVESSPAIKPAPPASGSESLTQDEMRRVREQVAARRNQGPPDAAPATPSTDAGSAADGLPNEVEKIRGDSERLQESASNSAGSAPQHKSAVPKLNLNASVGGQDASLATSSTADLAGAGSTKHQDSARKSDGKEEGDVPESENVKRHAANGQTSTYIAASKTQSPAAQVLVRAG